MFQELSLFFITKIIETYVHFVYAIDAMHIKNLYIALMNTQ